MTDFTQEQLDALAVFAGVVHCKNTAIVGGSDVYKLNGREICYVRDWQPHVKPEQADLVLRAMVTKVNVEICFGTHEIVTGKVVIGMWRKLGDRNVAFAHTVIGGDWWPDAVCRAALELIKNETI